MPSTPRSQAKTISRHGAVTATRHAKGPLIIGSLLIGGSHDVRLNSCADQHLQVVGSKGLKSSTREWIRNSLSEIQHAGEQPLVLSCRLNKPPIDLNI